MDAVEKASTLVWARFVYADVVGAWFQTTLWNVERMWNVEKNNQDVRVARCEHLEPGVEPPADDPRAP